MEAAEILHAGTCVYLDLMDKGQGAVIIRGPSGSGKSDLAFRLIGQGGFLVSDDQTLCRVETGVLKAFAVPNIAGCLEVRGVGLAKVPYRENVPVRLIVDLVADAKEIERMPVSSDEVILGVNIPVVKLYPFECSAVQKLQLIFKTIFNPKLLVE